MSVSEAKAGAVAELQVECKFTYLLPFVAPSRQIASLLPLCSRGGAPGVPILCQHGAAVAAAA
jgi:hypothetical protein